MSDETQEHGHETGEHDHGHGKAPDDGLLFPFLVVLAVALGVGWLTQPGAGQTATTPAEEPAAESATPEAPATIAEQAQAAPAAATEQPEQTAALEAPEAPGQSAAPGQLAAPDQTALLEAPGASGQPAPPAAPTPPSEPALAEETAAPAPAGAAGGGKFDRIAAMTALGRSAQAAARCRSAGARAGNVKVIATFAPDGHVSSARILSPGYIGTPTGSCILGHIKQTTVAPFQAGKKPANALANVHVY